MMRYATKVRALVATIAVLALILALGEIFSPERRLERAEAARLLHGKPEGVTALELGLPEGSIRLERRGEAWTLVEAGGEVPASASRVAAFLGEVAAVSRLEPRSDDEAAWPQLGLEEGRARRVRAFAASGATLADFAVGSYGPTGKEAYVRLGTDRRSYAAAGGFASYLSSRRQGWLDLRVLTPPLRPEDIAYIAMRGSLALDGQGAPERRLDWRAVRDGKGWSAAARELEPLALEAMARGLANLEAEDARAAAPEGAFSRIAFVIELGLGSGETRTLEVGAPTATGRYYLRVRGGRLAYEVSAYALKNLAKPLSELERK